MTLISNKVNPAQWSWRCYMQTLSSYQLLAPWRSFDSNVQLSDSALDQSCKIYRNILPLKKSDSTKAFCSEYNLCKWRHWVPNVSIRMNVHGDIWLLILPVSFEEMYKQRHSAHNTTFRIRVMYKSTFCSVYSRIRLNVEIENFVHLI